MLTERQHRNFWAKVRVDPSGCWLWTGARNDGGYGSLTADRRPLKAHRVSYELAHGPIPEGQGYHGVCVCHTCDNRLCVRPDHLFLGSNAANMADRNSKRRQARGESNGRTLYSDALIAEACALRNWGLSLRAIGRRLGISSGHVSRVTRGLSRAQHG